MKKLLLSFALFVGIAQAETKTVPAGYNAARFLETLAGEQNTTDSSIMRMAILMKSCPITSALGTLYMGATVYQLLNFIELNLKYTNPAVLQKLSPKIRTALKVIATIPAGLIGGWFCARGYQNWQVGEAYLYSPITVPA